MHEETPRRRRVFLAWLLTVGLFSGLIAASHRWCVCYAGGPFFLVISDERIVVPFPDGSPRTWSDWGWWIQTPWQDARHTIRPYVSMTRQIDAPGLHVPIQFLLVLSGVPLGAWVIATATMRRLRLFRLCGLTASIILAGFTLTHLTPVQHLASVRAASYIALTMTVCSLLRRPRARVNGRCRQCEYDLTGNESGICPECGVRLDQQAPPAPSRQDGQMPQYGQPERA